MVSKKNVPFKPALGKLFSLKRHRHIDLNPVPRGTDGLSYLDNGEGNITVLVVKESLKRVEILYDNVRYDMSKFYLQSPLTDSDEKITNINNSLQTLVNDYFILLEKNKDLSEDFIEFGKKLKKLQEACNKND
jgi:hypothetical protein